MTSAKQNRWRRRALKLLFFSIGILVAVLLTVFLYLRFGDLSRYRDTVADLLSDVLGREISISGDFVPEIGLRTRLFATDVALGNPSWCSEEHMATVDSLKIEVDLVSLVKGPLRILEVNVTGAELVLEDGGDGRVNWLFDLPKKEPPEDTAPFQLVIERASLEDFDFRFESPSRSMTAGVDFFEALSDDDGVLTVDLCGRFEDLPVKISGTIDDLPGLLGGGAVSHDLDGNFGNVALSLEGAIEELSTLTGVNVVLDAEGAGLDQVLAVFGVEGVDTGRFALAAAIKPTEEGFDVDLRADATDLEIEIKATLDSLAKPRMSDLEITAHGPSAAPVASLAGIDYLPSDPFEISGRVRWHGWPILFEAVNARVGENLLRIDGVLGRPPLMEETRFEVQGSGPDARTIGAFFGLDLPPGRYSIGGDVVREEESVRLQDVEVKIGATKVSLSGTVGDPPAYAGTDLKIEARGPDLSVFRGLARIDLPNLPFDVTGGLEPGDGAITLQGVAGRIGGNSFRLNGRISTGGGLFGSWISVSAEGADCSETASVFGIDDLPPLRCRLKGHVSAERGGFGVKGLEGSFGELGLSGEGFVSTKPGIKGSEARFEFAGPDISFPVSFVTSFGLPALPFRSGGAVRVDQEGYRLSDVTATIGDLDVMVDGLIGATPGADGTEVSVRIGGQRLATLGSVLQQAGWPATPFEAASDVQISEGVFSLSEAFFDLGVIEGQGSGTLVPATGLFGSELDLDIRGANLGALGRFLGEAGLGGLPELPEKPFTVSGFFSVDDSGYTLDDVGLSLDDAAVSIDGSIGHPPELKRTDVRFEGHGPNAALVNAFLDTPVPVAPFRFGGHIVRGESGVQFDQVSVQLGEYRVELDGALGEPPKLVGTDLQVSAQGPGTSLLHQIPGFPKIPDAPFELSGQFEGRPEAFSMREFFARYGSSDVTGRFRVDLTGSKPEVVARFKSDTIDLRPFGAKKEAVDDAEAPDSEVVQTSAKNGLLIPDTPIELQFLDRIDADVRWVATAVELPLRSLTNFQIDLVLNDGKLRVDPIEATGSGGGVLTGSIEVEAGDRGLEIRSRLGLDNGRIDLSPAENDQDRWLSFEWDFNLRTYGRSPRELAGHLDGWSGVALGEGVVGNSVMDYLAADIVVELLEAFNPFSQESESTHVDCAVIMLKMTDGLVVLEPLALQTERMTVIGDGTIDLKTEKIKLDWITKPRRGLGISASTITNPYIRLGGTLSSPSIELKPLEAAVSTGAAVATLGLTWAAKGFWNRITADRKVCKKAKERAGELIQENE